RMVVRVEAWSSASRIFAMCPKYAPSGRTGRGDSGKLLLLLRGKIRHEAGVVLRAGRHLDHGDAHLRREELLGVLAFVGVAAPAAAVLDDEVHLLDPFRPDDRIVLPERRHRDVRLVDALLLVRGSDRAAVPV